MNLPVPVPGLVIRYSYLWRSEHDRGRDEASKDRPSTIVLVTKREGNDTFVTVLPITHRAPGARDLAFEIPSTIKRRLGLDGERSWIMFGEANVFLWPGPDLRPLPGQDAASVAYGVLPPRLFEQLKKKLLDAARARRLRTTSRTT